MHSAIRTSHITDVDQLSQDIHDSKVPRGLLRETERLGRWTSCILEVGPLRGLVTKIVDLVQSKPDLWASTAIFITADEGGGYYDSGYVRSLDFLDDGTRIPLVVVSPYTKPVPHLAYLRRPRLGSEVHRTQLEPPAITGRSRDNLPNPTATTALPYVPTNSPASRSH
jgi:phospholipase C